MNHLHWMKLYIGDELSNTAHMTPAEFGSYIFLKMHYWRFGALPTDDERLARIAKVTAEQWREIMPSIGPLFEDDWRDPKLEAQREEAEERHKKLSEAGKKGGRSRKEEKPGYKPGYKPGLSNQNQNQNQNQNHKSDSDLDPEPAPEVPAYEEKEQKNRETMFTAFAIPSSAAKAREFLEGKKVPPGQIDECIRLMMGGNFSPYDLEGVLSAARSAAA